MSSQLKILFIAHDIPFPANHGGRVDMWNRIVALTRCGVQIDLVCWSNDPVHLQHIEHIRKTVRSVEVFERDRRPFLALHPFYPSSILSRRVPSTEYRRMLERLRQDKPDLIFLDGLLGSLIASEFERDLQIPVVYRSHNVEHQYIQQLYQAERHAVKKALLWSNIRRTLRVESRMRQESALTLDISQQDADAWRHVRGLPNPSILNPYLLLDGHAVQQQSATAGDIDFLYVGNLHTPNNVYGLKWFLQEVAPKIKGRSIVIAGSNPVPELQVLCNAAGIKLLPNPPEVQSLYQRAKVLINPIWHGSGVNIKMLEMLSTGKPVISTSVGSRGLSTQAKPFVTEADTPEEFANGMIARLDMPSTSEQADALSHVYGWENVSDLVAQLDKVVASAKTGRA